MNQRAFAKMTEGMSLGTLLEHLHELNLHFRGKRSIFNKWISGSTGGTIVCSSILPVRVIEVHAR